MDRALAHVFYGDIHIFASYGEVIAFQHKGVTLAIDRFPDRPLTLAARGHLTQTGPNITVVTRMEFAMKLAEALQAPPEGEE